MTKHFIAAAVVSFLITACATTAQTSPQTASANPPPGCVSDTGTHLPVPAGSCTDFGRVYTKADLDRTGQVNTQDALRMLDPSVTVRGR